MHPLALKGQYVKTKKVLAFSCPVVTKGHTILHNKEVLIIGLLSHVYPFVPTRNQKVKICLLNILSFVWM